MDNMVIKWDNTSNYPDLIWDDDAETVTAFLPTTEDIQEGYPFEVFVAAYEQIQYIEAYITPKDAIEWLQENKDLMGQENYDKAMKVVSQQIGNRGYTGTLEMRNIYKNNQV